MQGHSLEAVRPLQFNEPGLPFDLRASFVLGVERAGDSYVAAGNDPQILLKPARRLVGGWYQFIAQLEGAPRNPRIYFDCGSGFSESLVVDLTCSGTAGEFWGVAWVPGPIAWVRFDPSDMPCTFRLVGLAMDRLGTAELPAALSGLPLRPLADRPQADAGERAWPALATVDRLHGREANARVVLSRSTYLTGASLRFAPMPRDARQVTVELFGFEDGHMHRLRSVAIDAADVAAGEWIHVYWDTVVDSDCKFFLVHAHARDSQRDVQVVGHATLVHSPPMSHAALPQVVNFSPVTQCNLNCTHCISRSTRNKFAMASERVWAALSEVAAAPDFRWATMDYSGDILFSEVRHGGKLSRLIAMDFPFRMDTNANYLDEPVVDRMLASRLFEVNFSLDSMDAEVYANVRRGSIPLEQVLAKIARFMARKSIERPDIRTVMSFLLMRSNAATIKPAIAFARMHGIDFISVFPMIAFTPDMVDEVMVWDTEAYAALYTDLMAEAARAGVALVMEAPVRHWNEGEGHAPCTVPWGSAFILGNGDVQACCIPGTKVGNLEEKSLHEIWSGAEFQAFRTRVNSPDPPEPCRNCSMARIPNLRKAYAPARYSSDARYATQRARPVKLQRG